MPEFYEPTVAATENPSDFWGARVFVMEDQNEEDAEQGVVKASYGYKEI